MKDKFGSYTNRLIEVKWRETGPDSKGSDQIKCFIVNEDHVKNLFTKICGMNNILMHNELL